MSLVKGTFTTLDLHPSSQPETQNNKDFSIVPPFGFPADLAIGLNYVDIGHKANIRVKAYASKITNSDFTANIDAWSDTILHTAACDWLAMDPMDTDFLSGEFRTKDDHPSSQPQQETSFRVTFIVPFSKKPKVVVFLKSFDLSRHHNCRIKTYATGIDQNGFTIHIDTWDTSILYSAVAGWVAYDANRKNIFSDTASTLDLRPWNEPRAHNSSNVAFTGTNFSDTPTVFMAFNRLDIRNGHNLRVKCYSESVSTTRMTWHIDSWSDTVLWSAGISFICFV